MQTDVVVDGSEIGLWDKNDLIISHDALDWLIENIESWEGLWRTPPNGRKQELVFRFQTREDAIAFKLRWL